MSTKRREQAICVRAVLRDELARRRRAATVRRLLDEIEAAAEHGAEIFIQVIVAVSTRAHWRWRVSPFST